MNTRLGVDLSLVRGSLVLFMGCFALLCGCSSEKPVFPDFPEDRPNPLLILGIDGATWRVMEPMIAKGELPNFAALRERGVWGELITVVPSISPVVWTSFATGRFGRVHGILDFVYPYTPGEKRPVRSTDRLVPAVWNLASRAGLRTGLVGYYGSWPAEPIKGVNISDRAFDDEPDAIWPKNALDPFQADIAYLHSKAGREAVWERFFPWDYERGRSDPSNAAILAAEPWVDGPLDANLVYSEFIRRVSLGLLEGERRFDLFITYFRPVDIASHALWYFYDHSDFPKPPDPAVKALLGDVIPETYRYMDQVLGQLLQRMPENTNVIVISDHGFGSATGQYTVPKKRRDELTGNHRSDGIFIAAGPDIRSGHVASLTTMEIMPMVMALLGLPVADTLPGRVDYRVLAASLFEESPLKTVARYGARRIAEQGQASDTSTDEEVVKQLQGLGYVGSDFKLGTRGDGGTFDFWAISDHQIVRHLGEEILYYLIVQDIPSALGVLEDLERHKPELVRGVMQHAASLYRNVQRQTSQAQLPDATVKQFRARTKSKFLQ